VGFLDTQFDSITAPPPFGPVPTATATLDSSLPFAPETQGHVGISYAFRLGGGFR
jgi:iron complex outermembrane receptor protein